MKTVNDMIEKSEICQQHIKDVLNYINQGKAAVLKVKEDASKTVCISRAPEESFDNRYIIDDSTNENYAFGSGEQIFFWLYAQAPFITNVGYREDYIKWRSEDDEE